MKRKGFTLIELLAVIVILAVIALIATPLIMGTITKAKVNADKDSIYGMIKGVELNYFENGYQEEKEYTIQDGKIKEGSNTVAIKGSVIGTGKIKIDKEGHVGVYTEKGSYCYVKNIYANTVSATKGSCEPHNFWQEEQKFPFTEYGITIDYDKETQIYTMNGTATQPHLFLFKVTPFTFQVGETYTVGYEYLSGELKNVDATVAFETANKDGNIFPEGSRQYADPGLTTLKKFNISSFVINEFSAKNAFNARFNIWVDHGTFENYKIKISVAKGKSTQYIPSSGF